MRHLENERKIVLAVRKSVKLIPWLIRNFPGFTNISGIAIGKRFFLTSSSYKDLMSENPNDRVIALCIHELEHIKRSQQIGILKYQIYYILSPRFRYKEEMACHIPQLRYLKKRGLSFNIKKRAKILSGSLYFWCISYEKAERDLCNLWRAL